MFKEIKYFIFIIIFALFLFFSGKYYFSDTNKKRSYRSYNNISEKIDAFAQKQPILENDTNKIIEYVERSQDKNKKKFNFWKLLESDE